MEVARFIGVTLLLLEFDFVFLNASTTLTLCRVRRHVFLAFFFLFFLSPLLCKYSNPALTGANKINTAFIATTSKHVDIKKDSGDK